MEEHVRNIAAFPLAIPLMAGPGAITATILLASRSEGDTVRLLIALAVIAIVLALCFVVFVLAAQIAKRLGVTANRRDCSAFCSRRSPCSSSSTACAPHWPANRALRKPCKAYKSVSANC